MIHGGKVHTEPSRRFLRLWPVQAGGSAAPATFLVLRLLESNPHFVGAQTTLYRKREAAFLFSRNIPPSPCAGSPKAGAAAASQGLHRGGGSENFGVLGSPLTSTFFAFVPTHALLASILVSATGGRDQREQYRQAMQAYIHSLLLHLLGRHPNPPNAQGGHAAQPL